MSQDRREVIAIDGKTARRSGSPSKGKSPLHLVSAWASHAGLVLGQEACDEKSNEITAIPKLLDVLDLKGNIVTVDALGTQKEIGEPWGGAHAHFSQRGTIATEISVDAGPSVAISVGSAIMIMCGHSILHGNGRCVW